VTRTRWIAVAVVALAIYFALQGGEYSGLQLLELTRRVRAEQALVAELTREVDSLARVRKRVETDPAMQERMARELYGMLRPGEIEYTILKEPAPGSGPEARGSERR
jgi:cell division protein FtsB